MLYGEVLAGFPDSHKNQSTGGK